MAGSGLDWVKFVEPGLQIPALTSSFPAQVGSNTPAPVESHLDQYQVQINHSVSSVSSFNYTMFVQGHRLDGRLTSAVHDPTIVVTLDPMGG